MRGSAIWVGILAAVLPGMMLAPVWRLGGVCAGEDDVLYYYPARVWLHELFQKAEPPYLNPWSGLDRPMLADPQHAVFYPGTWLFLALPPKTAYPAALWLHYSLVFLGMYKLLRGMELDRPAATFGAIAFAFCGFMLAHRAHFTIQHTAAWTPWVFWRLRRFVEAGGGRRFAWACAAAAMQCLSGHIQIAALTALGSGVYVLGSLSNSRWRDLRRWFSVWLGAAVLAAVQLVPTFFFVAECTRTQRGYVDFVENSWYPQSAIGWILPMLLGQRTPNVFPQSYWGPSHQVEQFCYPGLLVLLGAAIALRSAWRSDAQRRPWVVLLLFALLTALGLFGPVAPLLYFLPGASLFRVPARAMLLFNLAAAVLAAVLAHDLGAKLSPQRARLRAILRSWFDRPLLLAALLLLTPIAVLAAVMPLLSPETRSAALAALRPNNPALLAPLAAAILSISAMFACSRKRSSPGWIASLPIVLLLDLAVVGWTIDVPTDADPRSSSFQSNSRAELLAALNGSTQRMWVVTGRTPDGAPGEYHDPIGKIVANTNILAHVPLLTDYGPLTPRRFDLAFHFKPWGEAEAAAAMLANDDWMQWYDIGWLLLCEPALTPPEGACFVAETAAGYRLFRYPFARGRAYFEKATQPGGVRYIEHSPHKFETRVDTWGGDVPGGEASPRVVVARLAIPGWHATWGRRELPIEPAGGVLLSVRLPPGERPIVIRWHYSPPGLAVGAAVSGIGWSSLLVLAAAGKSPRAKRRVRSTHRR